MTSGFGVGFDCPDEPSCSETSSLVANEALCGSTIPPHANSPEQTRAAH
jgi:hypothetical protein